MTERRRFVVRGQVQGVGYRYFIQKAARGLDLDGCVRNLPDGGVEIEAAGTAAQLAELERLAMQGPPAGRPDQLAQLAPTPDPLPHPFTITY